MLSLLPNYDQSHKNTEAIKVATYKQSKFVYLVINNKEVYI